MILMVKKLPGPGGDAALKLAEKTDRNSKQNDKDAIP